LRPGKKVNAWEKKKRTRRKGGTLSENRVLRYVEKIFKKVKDNRGTEERRTGERKKESVKMG